MKCNSKQNDCLFLAAQNQATANLAANLKYLRELWKENISLWQTNISKQDKNMKIFIDH